MSSDSRLVVAGPYRMPSLSIQHSANLLQYRTINISFYPHLISTPKVAFLLVRCGQQHGGIH